MGSMPTARPKYVRHSNFNRRDDSRRLRAFLSRMKDKLTGTGAQITAASTTDAGTKAEVSVTFVDPPTNGSYLTITTDDSVLDIRFVSALAGHVAENFVTVLIGVDIAECAQNLAYALTQDTDYPTKWANNASAGIPAEVEYVSHDTEQVTLGAVVVGTHANSWVAATDDANLTISDATFVGGVEPGCIVTTNPHGFTTGDGPLSLVGSSDSWTIDVASTLYYVIVVDANSFRLAPSPYDAVLGNYYTLHRPTIELGDEIKYRRAAESEVALYEQVRAGVSAEQLVAATDIDPA